MGEVKVQQGPFLLHSPLSVAPLGSFSSTSAPISAGASPWEGTQGIGGLVSPVGSWGAQDAWALGRESRLRGLPLPLWAPPLPRPRLPGGAARPLPRARINPLPLGRPRISGAEKRGGGGGGASAPRPRPLLPAARAAPPLSPRPRGPRAPTPPAPAVPQPGGRPLVPLARAPGAPAPAAHSGAAGGCTRASVPTPPTSHPLVPSSAPGAGPPDCCKSRSGPPAPLHPRSIARARASPGRARGHAPASPPPLPHLGGCRRCSSRRRRHRRLRGGPSRRAAAPGHVGWEGGLRGALKEPLRAFWPFFPRERPRRWQFLS